MRRLDGLDCLHLELESERTPMNTSSLTIYDRNAAAGGASFPDILRFVAERTHRAPLLRRRLANAPMNLARPSWVDDPAFDIEFHVRHIALPGPGDWHQLCTQVARLHARPLDRSRPLWECYVIEAIDRVPGAPRGSFALFFKTHLAALGGAHASQLFTAMHELAPDARASLPKGRRRPDRPPTLLDLAGAAAKDAAAAPAALARYAVAAALPAARWGLQEARTLVGRARAGPLSWSALRASAPPTRFNDRVSPHRVVDGVRLPLAVCERIAARVPGAGIEEVALAVIAGGLHAYLDEHGEAPPRSLVAEAPPRPRREARSRPGRLFADSALLKMGSDVADPAERLAAIVAALERSGAQQARFGRRLAVDALGLFPSPAMRVAAPLVARLHSGSRSAPAVNTSVAIVRAPEAPLYFAGAPLVGYYGYAALHDVAGIAHVIGRCGNAVTISVTACRSMLPDAERYAAHLAAAFDALAARLRVPHLRRRDVRAGPTAGRGAPPSAAGTARDRAA